MNLFHPLFYRHLLRDLFVFLTIALLVSTRTAQADAVNMTAYDPLIFVDQEKDLSDDTVGNSGFYDPGNYEKLELSRFENFTLNMPQLDDKEKDIIVYLPENYETNEFSYPVIYLQGAQELFFHIGASNEEWFFNSDLIDFYTKDIEGDVIIVGIQAESYYNWDEYSPWVNDDMYQWMDPYDANRIEGGRGDAYLAFLIQTLKPEIDNRYRTLPTRDHTAIAGSKMGGLISLYAGLTRPEIFSQVSVLSPAIWFAEAGGPWLSNNQLLTLINTLTSPDNVSFMIDVAAKDRTTELLTRPNIYDAQGKKISFPRAYLDGAQVVVESLVNAGLPLKNITGGIKDSEQGRFAEPEATPIDAKFINYFPTIFKSIIPPKITSEPAGDFIIDHDNEFTITTTGDPIPTITYIGTLPNGVTFKDNGDGTATLAGIPTEIDTIDHKITIQAINDAQEAATQYFTFRFIKNCPNGNSCVISFDISMLPYLDRSRKVWVYLPPGYNDNQANNYQVIYLTSAQHIFGASADTSLEDWADWKFDEKLDVLYANTGIGTIAVAVEFDADYPWSEYTPWNNRNMDNWSKYVEAVYAEGDALLDFMVKKLKPSIDLRYRTLPDREHTAIGGASRHALFAIYAGLREPEVFSKVMAMSPAVWLAEGGPVSRLYYPLWLKTNQLSVWFNENQAPTNVRYYLYVGTNESGTGGGYPFVYISDGGPKLEWDQAYEDGANKVRQKLVVDGVAFRYDINNGGTHIPGVWSEYIETALKYLGFY